jgi:hypothetical protein
MNLSLIQGMLPTGELEEVLLFERDVSSNASSLLLR